jgi:hypothetical protein
MDATPGESAEWEGGSRQDVARAQRWMLRLARFTLRVRLMLLAVAIQCCPWTFQTEPLVLPMRNAERIMFIHPGTTCTDSVSIAAQYP